MATVVIVDGEKFISEKALIEGMVKECVAYTNVDDLDVSESESYMTSTFQGLLKRMDLKSTGKLFHDRYVSERFIHRTLGV